MEGTSDFNLAMEWYLKYGEREITIEKEQKITHKAVILSQEAWLT